MATPHTEARVVYQELDPRCLAPVDVLRSIALTLAQDDREYSRSVVANTLLELAIHPDVPEAHAPDHTRLARRLLFAASTHGQYAQTSRNDETARIYFPHFEIGWTREACAAVRHNIGQQLSANRWPVVVWKDTDRLGQSYELITSLLLGYSGLQGLYPRQSLLRQEGNKYQLHGKKYAWDLTVFSDGTEIERGEYRLQIKSFRSERLKKYHREISRVVVGTALSIGQDDSESTFELARQIMNLRETERPSRRIRNAQRKLLHMMHSTGPVPYQPPRS